MIQDVSASGTKIWVVALPTYPQGFPITQFSDEGDPLDVAEQQMAEYTMSVNGDLILKRTPKPIEITLNVVANSDEEKILEALADAERVGKNKMSYRNIITMAVTYPDGMTKVLHNGVVTAATPLTAISSAGRFKVKTYKFAFEGKVV